MKQKDLKNIDKVIEFIHKYKNCKLQSSGRLNNAGIEETLQFLEDIRLDILDQI